ncbi:MAG: DNA polymerase I [Omnitrophica bacterium RIFCSPLOWO2_01_FULL_45_10]|nr:MAG: DNA polymerase I [Omnitrophica bacterium RIFCSPLOWO2_01_FULL_45_10]
MSRKRLFLIDGNSFCYRAYYAIRQLSTSKGQPTNAVYGFVTMLNKIVKDNKPDMLAVAFDLKGPTFRHEKFEEYKIHRRPMPDDLVGQLPIIKKIIGSYNIPIYEFQGYEADDILATLAKRAEERDIETFIVTGDKDALQLVNSNIKVYSTHNDGIIYDMKKIKEIYDVGSDKIVDIMALMGDDSDNIPGVRGIGEKSAVELIKEFGSLDNLLSNLEKVKGESKRKTLEENAQIAILSRELAVLDANVPIKVDFEDLKTKEPNREELFKLFKELEFKSLLKEHAPKDGLGSCYELIDDEKKFKYLVDRLRLLDEFVFDTETTSENPMLANLVGISFSWKVGSAFYVPLNKYLNRQDVLKGLKPIFEDPEVRKIGQNIKYDALVLANAGISLKGIAFDTMVASYLLNPSKLKHNLGDISIDYLNHKMTTSIEDLIGKGKKRISMNEVDVQKVSNYCCEDSDVTLRLKNLFQKELSMKDLDKLFHDVEIPLIEVLVSMEMNGVAIDKEYLERLSKEMGKKLHHLTAKIYDMAGGEFNVNSTKQLSAILFERLKLPVVRRTKTGRSTDEQVLRTLALVHPLPETLLEYRELSKLKSTYVDSLPQLINAKTGKIHTSFNQTVTQTGRLSSSDPNIQNIPVKTEEGKKIRMAFVPESDDNVLLSADYSQIELRILAHFSGDKTLIEAFREGRDIHAFTAALVFGVEEKDISPEMRNMAKTVNFGIIYGMSPYGLSQSLKIEVDKSKEFIDSYFERYPDVKNYIDDLIEEARVNGYVTTILGRRRYIPEINSPDIRMRQFAERTAINTPIQGSAADIIKVAMIEVHKRLGDEGLGSKMILQVHDELVFDAPKKELKKICRIVKNGMEKIANLKVPIEAHIGAGRNWLELEPVHG